MRSIIVGCGRVGAGLAGKLARAGDDVTVIDIRTEAFDRLDEGFSGQAVRGDGTDEDVLRRAGLDGADRFFALTEGDNRNILAAQLAAETFRVATVVAKVNDPVRAEAYASLGISTICRTSMMIEALSAFLGMRHDGAAGRVKVASGSHPEGEHHGNGSAAPGPRVAPAPTTGRGSEA
jgi:trk system potassium uptake protein TrkA